MRNLITLFIFISLFSSCVKEKIEPSFEPETYNDQRGDKPIVFDYPIRNLEVDRVGGDIGDVPVVGGVFQRLAEVLADISIETDAGVDGMEVPIEPQVFSVAELDEVDFNYINSISLEGVRLIVADKLDDFGFEEDENLRGLNFINKVQVFMDVDEVPQNQDEVDRLNDDRVDRVVTDEDENTVDIYGNTFNRTNDGNSVLRDVRDVHHINESSETKVDGNSLLVLSYDKQKDRGACSGECINMKVHSHDWKKILMHNRKFTIRVKLFIKQAPKESLRLDGHIRFSLGIDPGF